MLVFKTHLGARLKPILCVFRVEEDITPDRVVAGNSFGDWIRILDNGRPRDRLYNYEKTLWEPCLVNAFPHRGGLRRKDIHTELNHLWFLGNRVQTVLENRDAVLRGDCVL